MVQAPDRFVLAWLLAFVAATTLAATWVALRLAWQRMDWLALAAWPAAFLCFAMAAFAAPAPSANFGALGWASLLAALYAYLRVREQRWPITVGLLHVGAFWLVSALLVLEAVRRVGAVADGAWPLASGIAVAALAVAAVPVLRERVAWPFAAHGRAYGGLAAGGVASALAATIVIANFASDGAPTPFVFVPLANPLEVALLASGLVLWRWAAGAAALAPGEVPSVRQRAAGAAAAAWLFVTMAAARAVHHLGGVPFTFDALASSSTFQATLSLLWAIGGCGAMLVGARRGERVVWYVGAGLVAVVFAKLLLVELSSAGELGRLVSFLGVGVLLLVFGYFAPLPPREARGGPGAVNVAGK
jgi:uncharacterized membrane protein